MRGARATRAARAAGPGAGLVLLAVALATGCSPAGGDDEDRPSPSAASAAASGSPESEADRDTARASLVEVVAGRDGSPEVLEEAECFADELLAHVDPQWLADEGILARDFGTRRIDAPMPEGLAEQWAEAQLHCVDYVEVNTRAAVAATKGRLDASAYASCLGAELTEQQAKEATVATLTGEWDDPAVTELAQSQRTCRTRAAR